MCICHRASLSWCPILLPACTRSDFHQTLPCLVRRADTNCCYVPFQLRNNVFLCHFRALCSSRVLMSSPHHSHCYLTYLCLLCGLTRCCRTFACSKRVCKQLQTTACNDWDLLSKHASVHNSYLSDIPIFFLKWLGSCGERWARRIAVGVR